MSSSPEMAGHLCGLCCCCELERFDCHDCGGDGVVGHDCGEDCCACADPDDNVICSTCRGQGYWIACSGGCDAAGKHAAEDVEGL